MLDAVVVHYHAADWLAGTVESLLGSDVDLSLVVVNNGGVLPTLPAEVEVIEPRTNTGYAGGANTGIRRAATRGSPWVLAASHDLVVEPDTLRRLLEAGAADPTIGAIGPNLLGEVEGTEPVDVRRVSGTCLLLRRAALDDVGLFDETFGSYQEDTDLCFRLQDAGWRTVVLPAARASSRGTAHPRLGGPMMYANQVRLVRKRGGWWAGTRLVLVLPLLALRDLARSLRGEREVHLHRARSRLLGALRAIPQQLRTSPR